MDFKMFLTYGKEIKNIYCQLYWIYLYTYRHAQKFTHPITKHTAFSSKSLMCFSNRVCKLLRSSVTDRCMRHRGYICQIKKSNLKKFGHRVHFWKDLGPIYQANFTLLPSNRLPKYSLLNCRLPNYNLPKKQTNLSDN